MKALIVGAGLSGLTAGILLKRNGWDVRVLESRSCVGGNCVDKQCDGVYVHTYGPHIFHTNSQRVWRFINDFSDFTKYEHRVVAYTEQGAPLVPIPYSKATAEKLGRELTDEEIVNTFFRFYSEKMWGEPYELIPKTITDRVPKRRDDHDTRYFTDQYQGMPVDGYSRMFSRMAAELGPWAIDVECHYEAWKKYRGKVDLLVFTGMVDEYYEYKHGLLPYRALKFEFKQAQSQQVHAVINYCDSRPETRITDYSRFYDAEVTTTTLGTETPVQWDLFSEQVPSYPMRGFPKVDQAMARYDAMLPGGCVLLCGRLGAYKYMNMDATIADTMFRLEGKLGVTLY